MTPTPPPTIEGLQACVAYLERLNALYVWANNQLSELADLRQTPKVNAVLTAVLERAEALREKLTGVDPLASDDTPVQA